MRGRVAVLAALMALLSPALARASGAAVIADCNAHGQLTQRYSRADLQDAIRTMPSSMKEYTDCYDVIQRALLGGIRPSGPSGGGGGGDSFLPTPVIVVLVLLALAAAGLGAVALRRRGGGSPPGASAP